MGEGFDFRELRTPRIDASELLGLIMFDQRSTEFHPTGKPWSQGDNSAD